MLAEHPSLGEGEGAPETKCCPTLCFEGNWVPCVRPSIRQMSQTYWSAPRPPESSHRPRWSFSVFFLLHTCLLFSWVSWFQHDVYLLVYSSSSRCPDARGSVIPAGGRRPAWPHGSAPAQTIGEITWLIKPCLALGAFVTVSRCPAFQAAALPSDRRGTGGKCVSEP